MEKVYFPMTASILTPGHIKCLEFLSGKYQVIVGLLTSKALKGYKIELVPFNERKYVLETLSKLFNVKVVAQNSLNPRSNLKKYRCHYLASGDGFEPSELNAIKSLNVKPLDIKLPREKFKKYSSSKIYERIRTKK